MSPDPDAIDPPVVAAAAALCPEPVRGIARAGGGGNSRIYRVETAVRSYALKAYPSKADDARDRLGVERDALRFMVEHGVSCVPRLSGVDAARGFALLEWIDGAPVAAPAAADIDQAVAFLVAVAQLSDAPGAQLLPPASEACWSGAEIVRQVTMRGARLATVLNSEPALAGFLADRLAPLLGELKGWARAGYRAAGLDFEAELAPPFRALIPADFGFHNALRRVDGRLAFVDFEYFGWDDPVKLAADFLLHPAMDLSEPLKHRFGRGLCRAFAARDAAFPGRLRLLYPLFAMRWCLILLNEFLPDRWATRAHAGTGHAGGGLDWQAAKRRQLVRAEAMLEMIARGYRSFDYAG